MAVGLEAINWCPSKEMRNVDEEKSTDRVDSDRGGTGLSSRRSGCVDLGTVLCNRSVYFMCRSDACNPRMQEWQRGPRRH